MIFWTHDHAPTSVGLSARRAPCFFDCCRFGRPEIELPDHLFSNNEVVPEFRGRTFQGFYISPCGTVFCSLDCYCDYVAD
jgi:hypothetical protein